MRRLRQLTDWVRRITGYPAVRNAKAKALARALRWQVARRLGFKRALLSVGPARLYCYPGNAAASGCLYAGFMEWDEMAFAIRYLRPGEHFVDVGANVGTYTVYASTFVPGVRVTAAEPGDDARARLIENIGLNVSAQVNVVGKAVGANPGVAVFTVGKDALDSFSYDGSDETVEVEVTTLDDLAGEDAPSLVKIDVEGAELDVFKGGERLLASERPPTLIMEMNGLCERFGVAPEAIYEHLRQRGFSFFEYDATSNQLSEFEAIGLPPSSNLIATRDRGDLERRLVGQWSTEELLDVSVTARFERSIA